MPPSIVIIVCKTTNGGPTDQNAEKTGYQNREWYYEHGMMVCRRNEVQVHDAAADMGADARPFTPMECWRSALMMGSEWDAKHPNSVYRFWRVACPVPIRSGPHTSDPIIGWTLPDCGHRDTVICEVDSLI